MTAASVVTREDEPFLLVLVGRPNSGKSSLFNAVTGGHARVGNFPGITVDVLEAQVSLDNGSTAIVADLPGLYSLKRTTDPESDEGVALRFLQNARTSSRPWVAVQVIDATRLGLGLRLTRDLSAPLAIVITQRDVLEGQGRTIDVEALERATGVPVALVSARDADAKRVVLALASRALSHVRPLQAFDPETLAESVVREKPPDPRAVRRRTFTERADRLLLHPLLGPILFLSLMAAVFAAVFLVADPVTSVLDAGITWMRARLVSLLGAGLVTSFVTDGLLGGAGTVLAFMPQIVILTLAMELLDATGYLARGAFLVDRLLRLLGLSGYAFVPLLMGHACAVPAISATRIVRDPKERLVSILILPLMTCSARLPTYGLLLAAFFPHRTMLQAGLFVGLYFSGIAAGLVASLLLRRTVVKGKGLPLVLEMPSFRVPQPRLMWNKAMRASTRFLKDVATTIVLASAVLWVLLSVPLPSSRAVDAPVIERSVAAEIGRSLEPITRPAGFDWRINVALLGSFGARELMVGTLGIIFGIEGAQEDPAPLTQKLREAKAADQVTPAYSTRTALSILAFFVLACQCLSTVAAIRRETRTWRWPLFVVGYTYVAGYVAAVLVYQLARWMG